MQVLHQHFLGTQIKVWVDKSDICHTHLYRCYSLWWSVIMVIRWLYHKVNIFLYFLIFKFMSKSVRLSCIWLKIYLLKTIFSSYVCWMRFLLVSSPCLPLVFCRDLCQSAVGHRDILWHRAPFCLLICLLETLLAPMAGQGRWRTELDIRVATWKCWGREPRRRRGVLTLTPAAAEEGGPLLIFALPLSRSAGSASPPLLWPGGAGEGGGWRCSWGATWDPGALLPGHGLIPQQCW